jgi:transcriptional regulator with XRE-family HTH domain
MLQEKLGRQIAELRKTLGLTQPQLAKRIGCSVEFISLVERGVNAPSVAGLEKFAKVLKVKVLDLFAFEQREPPGRTPKPGSGQESTSKGVMQTPQDKLVEDRWYVGRGRTANVARWVRIGENPGRLTFVTIAWKIDQFVVKDEGYYRIDEEEGCFQPFALIDEGTVVESIGPGPAWGRHYAKVMSFDGQQQEPRPTGR